MRVSKQGAGRGRELLTAIGVQADVEPLATIVLVRVLWWLLGIAGLAVSLRALIFGDVVIPAGRAADNTIRPLHLLDIGQALFLSGKLYVDLADVHGLFPRWALSDRKINSRRKITPITASHFMNQA